MGIGLIHFNQGDYPKADPYYEEALSIFRKIKSQDHREIGNCLNNMAASYRNQERYKEAEVTV